MGFQFVKFLLTTIIIKQVGNFPLGCLYNDTVYREEQTVKTNEPCLSCVCRKGSLMCNLVVCIDPPDTPPGCFVVHQANECCPQIFCQDTYTENMVEVRTAFQSKNKTKRNDCFVNESIYAEGSAVPTSQLCEYCYCIGGEIKCIKPHCILAFEGCKSVYQKSSCCPTYYDCRDVSIDILESLKKNAVNSNSKILTKSFSSILNETIAKNILKLPKDLITSSKMSKFLGQTEDKLIWTTLKKLKLIPEKGMNGKGEHLEKETEKLENSTSSGIFFPVISNTANNNIGSANPKKQEQNGLIELDSHAVKNEDKYQPKKIPIFETTSEENFNFKHNPVFRPPIKRVQKFIFRPNFKKDSNSSIVLNNKELVVTSGVNFNSDLNMTFSALDSTRPVSVASLIKDLTQFHAIHRQSVKPLTVIYKNIIVDYYPEYFVTSARDSAKMKTVSENHRKSLTVHNFSSVSKSDLSILTNFMGQNLSRLCESIHSETIENDSFSHSFSCITNIQKKSTPLTNKTLIDTTTDGSLKNFLEENIKSTTMRSLRHKYSSKTKIQTMPTAEFARRNVLEQSTIQPRTHNKTLISIEKEEKKVYRNLIIAPLEEHKNITTLELRRGFDYGKEADIQMKKLEGNSSHSNRKSESATLIKPNLGNYLKLAGCNIYGRMYRIGKIIPELSGPCLECLCTDLGVQCSSLHC